MDNAYEGIKDQLMDGVGASPGVAIGPVVSVAVESVELTDIPNPVESIGASATRVSAKLKDLSEQTRAAGRDDAADVLQAQSLMAEDPMIPDAVSEQLDAGLAPAEAFETAAAGLSALLASLPDPYLAARAADIGEVMAAIKRDLAGVDSEGLTITEPSILIAHELTAAETAGLDADLVLGFATETGGATSHVAIIARSLGVPAVVGVSDLLQAAPTTACLDGGTGAFAADPSDEVKGVFEETAAARASLQLRLDEVQGLKATFGDTPIEVPANIAGDDDIPKAVEVQSDGVGLYRTEFLFLDVAKPPTEEQQFEAYKLAAESWEETVVIRTFDIGGDKPAEYLNMEAEENPFLGMRGVRIYDEFPELIDSQIRAALRASAFGDISLMVPMVATVDEFLGVKQRVIDQRAKLDSENVEMGDIKLGVMVEVPSVALNAHRFAEHVDFFSIGTNDLTQYTMAADRMLGSLALLHDPLHPAVVRLCEMVAAAGNAKGIQTSVCGLAAEDPLAAIIFASVGITKLSVSANSVNLIKATIAAQDVSIVEVVQRILDSAESAAQVRQQLGPHVVNP